MSSFDAVSELVTEKLADRGHSAPVADTDSLFLSGKLDSMAVIELIVLLEAEYGIDFADADFDLSKVDTMRDIRSVIEARAA